MIPKAVGVPVQIEHHGPVQEPVEHGRGDGGVTEDLTPLADTAVCRHDDRGLQIPLRDNLKQRRRRLTGQREIAQFVDLYRRLIWGNDREFVCLRR